MSKATDALLVEFDELLIECCNSMWQQYKTEQGQIVKLITPVKEHTNACTQ